MTYFPFQMHVAGERYFRAETQQYRQRMAVSPTRDWLLATDVLIRTLVREDAWTDHYAIFLYANDREDGAVLNVRSTSYTGVRKVGASTSNAGTTFDRGLGITGNGTDGWIDHSIVPASVGAGFTATNNYLWVAISDDQSTASHAIAASGGGNNFLIRPRLGAQAGFANCAPFIEPEAHPFSTGFLSSSRFEAATVIHNIDGQDRSKTIMSVALPTSGFAAFRNGTTSANYYGGRIAAWGIAGGNIPISQPRRNAIASAVLAWFNALGLDEFRPERESVDGVYFGEASTDARVPPTFKIFQQSIPPADDASTGTFKLFPATDYMSVTLGRLASSTYTRPHGRWPFVPGHRSYENRPIGDNNVTPIINYLGKICAVQYSTFAIANATFHALMAYHAGRGGHTANNDGYLDYLNSVGLPDSAAVLWDVANASPGSYFSLTPSNGNGRQISARDILILPLAAERAVSIPNCPGVCVDWEVGDRRTNDEIAIDPIIEAVDIIHSANLQFYLFTNPFTVGSAIAHGFNKGNIWRLTEAVDYYSLHAYNRPGFRDMRAQLDDQIAMTTGPLSDKDPFYEKTIITVVIGAQNAEMEDDQALDVFNWRMEHGSAGVVFSRYFGVPGAGVPAPDPPRAYNRVISYVCFGELVPQSGGEAGSPLGLLLTLTKNE